MTSKTSKIQKLILYYMSDADIHEISEIKKYVMQEIDEYIHDTNFYNSMSRLLKRGALEKPKEGNIVWQGFTYLKMIVYLIN